MVPPTLRSTVPIATLLAMLVAGFATPAQGAEPFDWTRAADLPEALGVAGAFVGVDNGALIVAGGAHFPTSPARGGVKRWVDAIWVLEPGAAHWIEAGALPFPLAYGASISTPDGMLLIGGSDAERHHPNVMRLRWEGGEAHIVQLPALPAAAAYFAAGLLDQTVYVLGGQAAPDSTQALDVVWAADLEDLANPVSLPIWRRAPSWLGPARILPVAAAQDDALYLISGAELLPDGAGGATRRFLNDAYRYTPDAGWTSVAGPPSPVVAAPALAWGAAHVLVFGGDDGSLFDRGGELGDDHPGFSGRIRAYHTITDTWSDAGPTPFARVTTTAAEWQGGAVVVSGEDRPGHRSPEAWLGEPRAAATGFGTIDFVVLGLYLGSLVAMGAVFSRRKGGTEHFFLAGRRIPWWAAGLSIYGTQLSSISFIAMPAKVYSTDWTYFLLQMTIIMVAFPVVWIYLPFFRRVNLTSAYEYLEARFNLAVRLFASAAFVLYQLGRMAVVLFLPSIALSTVTGIDVYVCIALMGVLATFYTVMGGIEAVIWTDVVQVVVLLGGAVVSLGVILANIDGGFSGLLAAGRSHGKFHMFDWSGDYTTAAVWVVVLGNFFNNLVPYSSDQAVVQRYLTTKDEQAAARAVWTNALMILPSTLILFLLGTGLWAFYRERPELLDANLAGDSIFPLFIAQQLPLGLGGLVIAGVFAASMSTLDSSLNSVATAITTDFYGRLRGTTSDAAKLRLARALTALFGAVATASAVLLASLDVGSLWDTFQAAMGLFGGSLAGLFALGVLTRRANGPGAMVGALASVAVLAWVQHNTPVHFFLYGMIGVLSCMLVGYLASFCFPSAHKSLAGLTLFTRRGNQPDSTAV